jgi:UDP-3-O-[3-hydroxymyristoyl] glucosamine N-acyltransferase
VGARTRIGAGAHIGKEARIGAGCLIHPRVCILDRCVLGDPCRRRDRRGWVRIRPG